MKKRKGRITNGHETVVGLLTCAMCVGAELVFCCLSHKAKGLMRILGESTEPPSTFPPDLSPRRALRNQEAPPEVEVDRKLSEDQIRNNNGSAKECPPCVSDIGDCEVYDFLPAAGVAVVAAIVLGFTGHHFVRHPRHPEAENEVEVLAQGENEAAPPALLPPTHPPVAQSETRSHLRPPPRASAGRTA